MTRGRAPTSLVGRPDAVAREVARLARAIIGPSVEVIWFGSWPQGRAEPRSDLDIALQWDGPIPLERMAALREAVEELPTLYEVDLVDLASAASSLRAEIRRSAVRL